MMNPLKFDFNDILSDLFNVLWVMLGTSIICIKDNTLPPLAQVPCDKSKESKNGNGFSSHP